MSPHASNNGSDRSQITQPTDTQSPGRLASETALQPAGGDDARAATGDAAAQGVNALLHDLHDGRAEVGDLGPERRQECVAHLTLEGFSATEIAQFMRMGERSVHRDRAA